ncbi:NrfD/PsrC family molybdoenzyme membrane anchor subunit [Noviherbaspirillum galbum]|uniref:Polysulfide reductase NrfD n=1 Tax=Noviherbaspirillum galbum TaxID=2709383 RepID=A0A6B3SNY9_9BURK|nr:NrfD/PsrC family molybdoenzyme membrane anchor subunit [Noviherbaspirillum galbum]NEX61005.1 polysulfide reductase NrfD [Noviherbaspirillum galbum]
MRQIEAIAASPRHQRPGVPASRPLPDALPAKASAGVAQTRPDRTAARHDGPDYYGLPAVKASNYGALVWLYTYLAGLAGSSQVIATLADLAGKGEGWRSAIRTGRMIAALGPVVGAGLLIADLHTPQRWYNMVRIFRASSPMSIGSYLLLAFGSSSGLAALGDLAGWRWLTLLAQAPAAAAGAGMSVYTAGLLSATSTPYWAAAPRLLAARFACSAFATAAAGLSLVQTLRGQTRQAQVLDRMTALATLGEHVATRLSERHYREAGVDAVLEEPRLAAQHRLAHQIGTVLPLACMAVNAVLPRRSRSLAVAGSVGALAGGLLMRATVFHAGNRSAQRPDVYFSLTRKGRKEIAGRAPGKLG